MRKYVFTLGEVLLLAAAFLAVAILHNYIWVPRSGSYGEYLQHNLPLWISIMFAIDTVLFVIIFRIKKAVQKERYVSVRQMSNFSKLSQKDLILCTYIAVSGALIFICLLNISFISKAFPDLNEYINLFMKSDSFILTLLGLAVIGPLFEEIFFRGILFNILRKNVPFIVSLVIQAIIYGYCQPSPSIQVIGFFLAIIYGLMYYKLKTIWSTLYTAMLLNAFLFTTKQIGLHDAFAKFSNFTLFMIAFLCGFVLISSLVILWKKELKTGYVKVIGNLLLWTSLYVIVYYPFLFLWNNKIMNITAISSWLGNNNVIGFVLFDTVSLTVFYLVMKSVHKKNLFVVSNFSKIPISISVWIAILGVGMGVWVQCFFTIPYFAEKFPQFEQLFDYLTTAILPVFIVFLLLHSVYKEIYFRALVYNVLRPVYSIPLSIVITAIIYGGLFFNWDIALTIYASAGALIFGMLFEWYRSIWAPIVNEVLLFGTYYVVKNMNIAYSYWILVALAVSTIVVISIMYLLWKRRELGNTQEPEQAEDIVGLEINTGQVSLNN